MSEAKSTYRIMISGGGTGGHIYPAISIAQSLQLILENVDILFVGAKGKMEMKKVPEAGFKIVGLWISGIQRSLSWKNLLFPLKVTSSLIASYRLIKEFKPHAVVGVGGYASGPLLFIATILKVPTLIQEQNSYAGLTNKWLSGRVNKICVAHDGMEAYFPAGKLVVTGNPVRASLKKAIDQKKKAVVHFNFSTEKPVVLVLGGSLGARTLNECMLDSLVSLQENQIQLIWQTGGFYYHEMLERSKENTSAQVVIKEFIREMDLAYAAADIVVSRAGALSLAELMLVGKPSILVPSPNVAEDHQTKNALTLVDRNAALLVADQAAREKLLGAILQLIHDKEKQQELSQNISAMAHPDASKTIANEIIKLVA